MIEKSSGQEYNFSPQEEKTVGAGNVIVPERRTGNARGERLDLQECDPFDDFLEHIDQNAERRPPTVKEREKMDANLDKLGKIFEGSHIKWHIDGALNISLLKGQYIGIHKDIDISVEQAELVEVQELLRKKGYGFFLSYPKDPDRPKGAKIMERVDSRGLSEAQSRHLMLAAIDEGGKIQKAETLNFVDVHLIKRDEEGNPTGWGGVKLPSKWFEAHPINFHGREVHLSHPAKVAYFKLHGKRAYDRTDLKALTETRTLTAEDVGDIRQILEQETLAYEREARKLLARVAAKLTPDMSAGDIFRVFVQEPVIAQELGKIRELLETLSQTLEKASDKSRGATIQSAFEIFNFKMSVEDMRNKLEELARWVEQ